MLESKLPLRAGQPLDRALMQASRESALDELRDHGFPYASVRMSEVEGASPKSRVVSLVADPGPLSTFGPIEVVGNTSVGDDVIRRQLAYRPGRPFRQSALQESQRRLYSPELFEFANVEPVRSDEKPPEIPTRVTVTEGKHQRVNFGVGYGTEEQGRVQVDWRNVNFLGGARTAGVLRAVLGARSRRPVELHGAVFLRASLRPERDGAVVALRRARLHAGHQRRTRSP